MRLVTEQTILREERDALFSWAALFLFVTGVLTPVEVEYIGLLYVGEVILAITAIWAIATSGHKPYFWNRSITIPLIFLLVTLAGYVVSDLLNGSPRDNLLRGWARVLFVGTNIIAMHAVCNRKPVRLLAYCAGLAIGIMIVREPENNVYALYKVTFAYPLTLITLLLVALPRFRARFLVAGFALMAIGTLHVLLDFRSMGTYCLIAGAVVLAKHVGRARLRALLPALIGISLVAAASVLVYTYIRSQEGFSERRAESNSYRFAAIATTWHGIQQSPWIGNGSWAASSELDNVMAAKALETGVYIGHGGYAGGHSETLQAWFEAGLLGLAFFLFLLVSIVRAIWYAILRAPLTTFFPFAMFFLSLGLFDLFFSPFTGGSRMTVTILVLTLGYLRQERKTMTQRVLLVHHDAIPVAS